MALDMEKITTAMEDQKPEDFAKEIRQELNNRMQSMTDNIRHTVLVSKGFVAKEPEGSGE